MSDVGEIFYSRSTVKEYEGKAGKNGFECRSDSSA